MIFPLLFAVLTALDKAGAEKLVLVKVTASTQTADSVLVVRTAGLVVGQEYTQARLRTELADAVRRIYELGLFSQVAVDTSIVSDGVSVRFRTKEYPRLQRLEFNGYRRVRLKDLEAKVKAQTGEVLSGKKIFDWQEAIKQMYKEKGFLLVRVEPVLSAADSAGWASLTYQIEENEPVRIRNIEIVGNESFTDPQIEIKMVNRQKTWYRKARFREEEFAKDLERIVDFYKEHGFLDCRVIDYDINYNQGWADIVIRLQEGEPYYFGSVTFVGDSVLSRDQLRALVRFKPGSRYNAKLAQQTLTDLYAAYSEEGYIYASVVPTEEMRADTVDITYNIVEGRPALVRLVLIEGNEQTMDKVIRRNISTLPGYRFRRSEVMRSQRDVFNLGYFEDISLSHRIADSAGSIDLIYRVKEKKFFGTVGAGVTYSASEGVTGYIELQQPNLLGRGQTASVKVEKGGKRTNAQIGFSEPWLWDMPVSAGADVGYLTTTYDYYNKQELGGGVSFSRPLPLDYARGSIGVRISDAYVPPSSISPSYKPRGPYNIFRDTVHKTALSPTVTFFRDSRDYIFNATSGSVTSYSFGISVGDIRFHRHVVDISQYFPLFWKFAVMGRARMGLISGFSESDTVPLYERFRPGGTGPDGIRGYPDGSVGPKDGGYYIGGQAEAVFSLEYKLRLSPQLSFLAFADAGNAWNSIRQFNLSDMKRGAGVGVRIEIPMLGRLGFDLGYGFDRAGGGRWEPHFQLGQTF